MFYRLVLTWFRVTSSKITTDFSLGITQDIVAAGIRPVLGSLALDTSVDCFHFPFDCWRTSDYCRIDLFRHCSGSFRAILQRFSLYITQDIGAAGICPVLGPLHSILLSISFWIADSF